MNVLRSILLTVILVSTALAADQTFYVAVNVTAPASVKDSISTETTQALRRFPDVKIVSSDENYAVSLVCMDIHIDVDLACSLEITHSADYDWFKAAVKPNNVEGWKAMTTMIKHSPQAVFQQVYVIGVNKLEWVGRDIADTLNTQFLEGLRQLDSTLQRSAAPTTSNTR